MTSPWPSPQGDPEGARESAELRHLLAWRAPPPPPIPLFLDWQPPIPPPTVRRAVGATTAHSEQPAPFAARRPPPPPSTSPRAAPAGIATHRPRYEPADDYARNMRGLIVVVSVAVLVAAALVVVYWVGASSGPRLR